MATTVKVVLRQKKNKDGHHPVTIRITRYGKPAFITLGYVPLECWDNSAREVMSSFKNSRRFNALITSRKSEADEIALEADRDHPELTAEDIKHWVEGKQPGSVNKTNNKNASFFKYADLYLERLHDRNSFNQEDTDRCRINVFQAYLDEKDIAFEKITKSFLLKFETHLRTVRKVKDKTIANYMMMLQAVVKVAKDEKAISKDFNPFGSDPESYKINVPESMKIGLSPAHLKCLIEYECKTSGQRRALDVWFMAFYFAGMRVSDVLRLRWSDFYNDRLYYRMGKNDKPGSVKIPEQVYPILMRYEDKKRYDDDYVFPDLKELYGTNDLVGIKKRIKSASFNYNRTINERIIPQTNIGRSVTMHIGRHTFAGLAKGSISTSLLQELYRHSDPRTTQNYQKSFATERVDDALNSVLGEL